MNRKLLINRLGFDKDEFFEGVAHIVRRDIGIGDLDEKVDLEVSLIGSFAQDLIGFTRSGIDGETMRINYFPNGRVVGKSYNVDLVVESEFNRQYN